MVRFTALFALVLLAGCPSADPPGDDPPPPGDPPPLGDVLLYGDRSANTSTFFEATDVEIWGETAYVCTGVRSLNLHDITSLSAPEQFRVLTFQGSHGSYPRCSHVNGTEDRAVVVSHQDEVQRTPWVALLDVSDPPNPVVLDEFSTETPLEEPVLVGDSLYVAAHENGIAHFDVSGDTLFEPAITGGFGNVARITTFGAFLAAGTLTGEVLFLTPGTLAESASIDLGSPIQALLEVGDNRLLVALGTDGLALLDSSGAVLDRIDTHGISLRLDTFDDGNILVTNWSDLRVYSVAGDVLTLVGVDAVFQADERPRHLAAGVRGTKIATGEWDGVHTLAYVPGVGGPEITPSDLLIKIPAVPESQTVELTFLNEGNHPLDITGFGLEGDWSIDSGALTLAPGESHTAELTHPGSDINLAETLVVESNDLDEPRVEIDLRVGSPDISVGDVAPTFTYTGLNTGEVHDLEAQRGRVVLLSYFGVF